MPKRWCGRPPTPFHESKRKSTHRSLLLASAQVTEDMIQEALRHANGIGPARLAQLHALGIRTWDDVLGRSHQIPAGMRSSLVEECQRCLEAHQAKSLDYFVTSLHAADKWRILAEYLTETTFFDIETDGLEYDARITVIACWHRGTLQTFVEHENLDDFLTLLDDVTLLASFNGNSFDVPRVLDAFHIPQLPCTHLDLRWPAFHHGLQGGLKEILPRIGVVRPDDLDDVDGAAAIHLWEMWCRDRHEPARDQLLRYCASDVLALRFLADHLVRGDGLDAAEVWSQLPHASTSVEVEARVKTAAVFRDDAFGDGSPSRIRAFRSRRTVG